MKALRDFFEKKMLFGVIFITGASVLVIEVIAIRMLSPYFGNTIFSVSSVLSVILAALSIGYFVGGRLADRKPSLSLFFFLISLGGLSVLILQALNAFFLPTVGYDLSLVTGPLITAAFLFFVPAFLLGMLSPYVIKLQQDREPDTGIGTISGAVFFYSTLGSIIGSLLAGFILIPSFGIDTIVITVGVLLLLLGSLPLFKMKLFDSRLCGCIVAIIAIAIACISIFTPLLRPIGENVVYKDDGLYSQIKIYDENSSKGTVRFLNRDRNLSSGMYLDSVEHTFEYTKYYRLYKIFTPDLNTVFALGGGAYTVPKSFIDDLPDVTVDVAEIEPSLYTLAKKYFNLPESPRLTNYIKDGRRFLYDTKNTYDFIYSDAYKSFSIPTHLTTKEFFEIAKKRLSENGVFVANVVGILNPENNRSFVLSEIKTFQSVFPNSYFFKVFPYSTKSSDNIVFVGYNGNERIDIDEVAANHPDSIIRSLPERMIDVDELDFSRSDILTDNYAPVDYLVSKKLINMRK